MGGCCYRERKLPESPSIAKKGSKAANTPKRQLKKPPTEIDTDLRSKSMSVGAKPRREVRSDSVKLRLNFIRPSQIKRAITAASGLDESLFSKFEIPLKQLKLPIYQKFTFKNEINRSSSGVVMLVEHARTRHLHIIRKVERDDRNDRNQAEELTQENLLWQELEILHKIDHPNVLRVIQIHADKTHFYTVSEAMIGCTLVDFKTVAETQSETTITDILTQMLQAMSYCHELNIIHKNIRINNVLLFESISKRFHVKIVGFGGVRSRAEENLSVVTSQLLYSAPEAFYNQFSELGDVWSCGVVFYLLLTKTVPFYAFSKVELHESLQKPFQIPASYANSWPEDLISLLRSMLNPNISSRPTASQCLSHPYFQQRRCYVTSTNLNTALANLRTFVCGQRIKMIILSFIYAHVISPDEKQPLIDVFRCIDTDGDGKLSKEELVRAYENLNTKEVAELVAARVLESVDLDGSGLLDFSEFMVAASDHRSLLKQKNLKIAYELFDQDKSGDISKEELKAMLMCEESEEQWEEIMRQVDRNNDAKLNFKEFSKLIRLAVEQAETLRAKEHQSLLRQ